MTRYYFHATDGYAAVFDTAGRGLADETFEHAAALAAMRIRHRFGTLADLSDWSIVVQDDCGEQIDVLPFDGLPAVIRQAA